MPLITLFLATYGEATFAQQVTSPERHFGFRIGDDYMLANYKQMESYFLKVAQESDRVLIREAGLTEEGRKQYLLIVSSPENLKHIEKYRGISQRLGRAEGLTDSEALQLAKEGKPVVWIDGGMHSNETVGSHQLIETLYQLTSRNDEEILRYLDKVIILMWHVNPDGQELIADWYMQYADKEKRNMHIPVLYHKYVGHDNNRDYFMFNLKETENLAKVMYIDWLPQIIYNHHQTSPDGTIVAGPPYRDPFNHVFDPLLITGIDGVGAAMINRLNVEDKPGYVRLDQSTFSTWWNGGLRTAPYFRNMIGILTEITGNPTPSVIPAVAERQIPRNGLPNPVDPQKWHFRQSIDYSVSLNFAILDYAARNGDQLLYNFYKMGKNSIERGSRDHWTKYPKFAEAMERSYDEAVKSGKEAKKEPTGYYRSKIIPDSYYESVYKNPSNRDPRGYIISADQPDFGTAIKFVNALIKGGVYVYQSTSDFTYGGKRYPKNSIVVKTNQAFRPQILDMFEPQDHPHDVQYPGGPPVRPYDAAGWTLAMQMGVEYDRIYEDITAPLERKPYGELLKAPSVEVSVSKVGYILPAQSNDSFIAINRLLKSGHRVYRDEQSKDFFVEPRGRDIVVQVAREYGVRARGATVKSSRLKPIEKLKIGLYDYYGGSMPSGWVRWIFEQYGFEYRQFFPQDVDSRKIDDFDVLIFVGQGIPTGDGGGYRSRQPEASLVPEAYRHMLGELSKDKSVGVLKEYVEKGGKIITIGSSSAWVYGLNIGVTNPLVERNEEAKEVPLPSNKYYIPTSILRADIDVSKPENYGMPAQVNIVFNNSPVFRIGESGQVYSLGKISTDKPLLSGWAHGQHYLKDTHIGVVATLGKGKVVAIGPEITNRAQAHATFKMLFNQLYK